MTKSMEWTFDDTHRIHRACFHGEHDLLVADRADNQFDVLVVASASGETLWVSNRTYASPADAKRAGVAAAKRLTKRLFEPAVIGQVSDEMSDAMPSDVNTTRSGSFNARSIWQLEDGRHVAAFENALQTARCAIVPLDPDHYLGFIRISGMVLRIPYSNLLEAKRGLVTRVRGLLDQLLPDGMYAGGI